MLVSRKKVMRDAIMQNLLSAHKQIADHGCVPEIIRFTKFLTALIDKTEDVLIEVIPEGDEKWSRDPVDNLE